MGSACVTGAMRDRDIEGSERGQYAAVERDLRAPDASRGLVAQTRDEG